MSNERDPDLEQLYRAHSREEPPPALDAAILAAAHRAVASGPQRAGPQATRPQRWWMPLAAAATIGVVAIGVIQQMPKDTAIDATSMAPASAPVTPAPPPPMSQAPSAPAPAASPPPAQAPVTVAEQNAAPAEIESLAKKRKEADAPRRQVPPPPPAAPAAKSATGKTTAQEEARENKVVSDKLVAEPMPFPAAQAPRKAEVASVEAKRDAPKEQPMADARKDSFRDEGVRAERQAAAPAVTTPPPPPPAAAPATAPPPPPAAPAPAPAPLQSLSSRLRSAQSDSAAAGAAAPSKNVESEMRELSRDPDAWIARIRKLRDAGNTEQALRELKEFRALVPDAERKLPADLRSLQP